MITLRPRARARQVNLVFHGAATLDTPPEPLRPFSVADFGETRPHQIRALDHHLHTALANFDAAYQKHVGAPGTSGHHTAVRAFAHLAADKLLDLYKDKDGAPRNTIETDLHLFNRMNGMHLRVETATHYDDGGKPDWYYRLFGL